MKYSHVFMGALGLLSATDVSACTRWSLTPQIVLRHAGGWTVAELAENAGQVTGAVHRYAGQDASTTGSARGRLTGDRLWLQVSWADGRSEVYEGQIGSDGRLAGAAFGPDNAQERLEWTSSMPLACSDRTARRSGIGSISEVARAAVDIIDAVRGRRNRGGGDRYSPDPIDAQSAAGSDTGGASSFDPQPGGATSSNFDLGAAGGIEAQENGQGLPASGFDPEADLGESSAADPNPSRVPRRNAERAGVDQRAADLRLRGTTTSSAVTSNMSEPFRRPASEAGTRCAIGYVWREARPADRACVPPSARQRVVTENRLAPMRRNPAGAWGPQSCRAGFVWREAFSGDTACVTPDARSQAAEENRRALSRRATN